MPLGRERSVGFPFRLLQLPTRSNGSCSFRRPGSPLRWSAHAGKKAADISFAVNALGRSRLRSHSRLGIPQAAGTGCNPSCVSSVRPSPPCGRSACNADRPLFSRYSGNMTREGVSGGASCGVCTKRKSRKRVQSSARLCRAMHVCAEEISGRSASTFGRSKPLNNWRLRSAVRFALQPMKYPANARHQRKLSTSCAESFSINPLSSVMGNHALSRKEI